MIPKIGDRVILTKNSNLRSRDVGSGKGVIVGLNPFHPERCFNVKFDNGSIINNVHIEDLELLRIKVIFT